MSLWTRVPRCPTHHWRVLCHPTQTLASRITHWPGTAPREEPTAAAAAHGLMAPSSRQTLAGASLVALGAGALLCARAYGSGSTTTGSRSRGSSSLAGSEVSVSSSPGRKTAEVEEMSENTQTEGDGQAAPKQPCGGCDCGLMEPGPIEGTMHAYERHIIICSGHQNWPKVVEAEESSLAESLFNLCLGAGLIFTKKVALAAKKAGAPKTRQVKISACSEPSRGPEGTTDVIVYPEGLIYSLSRDDTSSLEQFFNVQLINGAVATQLKPVPVPYKKMVLVCTHMSRDKRCGRAGPQVIGEMEKALQEKGVGPDEIAVRGSSHFGGHKYAGVLIIYPQGDWFGLVSKKNAPAIVDKCVLGTEGMKANWRGNMANPGTKKEPATKPEPATAAAAAAGPTPTQEPKSAKSAAINGGGPTAKPRRESIDGA
ncbi:unnamed protein product [Ectocarpus sp. 4 AP-2014]